jgi:hypothetical protein
MNFSGVRVCTRVLGVLLLTFGFATLLFAQTHPTFEDVTLIKRDGWTYKNVSLTLNQDDSSIRMTRSDGAVLNVPLKDIGRILDKDGHDITSVILLDFPGSPGATKPSDPTSIVRPTYDEFGVEGDPEVVTGSWVFEESEPPKMFDVMIVGGLGYSSPKAPFYDGMDGGLQYLGEMCLAVSPRNYIRLGYRTMRAFDETLTFYDYDLDAGYTIRATADFNQYFISMGKLSRPNGQNDIRLYGEFGVSFVDHVFKVKENDYPEREKSEMRVLLLLKGGALIPIQNRVGLDVGLSLGMKSFGGNENEGLGFLFDAHVGVMYQFGQY